MVRYVFFFVVVLLVFMTAVVFAAINTDVITLDLAFTRIETKMSLAMISFLAAGWVFGAICAGLFSLKLLLERRQLKYALRLAESEVKSLRSMPLNDAN
jgi:uncharacterized membrane protein YciS (DUF1049 family)